MRFLFPHVSIWIVIFLLFCKQLQSIHFFDIFLFAFHIFQRFILKIKSSLSFLNSFVLFKNLIYSLLSWITFAVESNLLLEGVFSVLHCSASNLSWFKSCSCKARIVGSVLLDLFFCVSQLLDLISFIVYKGLTVFWLSSNWL